MRFNKLPTDQQLIDELLKLQPMLRRFAFGMCQSRQDADDIVQSSYERALTRLHQWQPGTHLGNWMFSIVRSVALNHIRGVNVRKKHYADSEPDMLLDTAIARPDKNLEFKEVGLAISQLPNDQREAVLLITVEGFSYKEAASIIGISESALTSRLARGRLALVEILSGGKNKIENSILDFRSK